MKKEEKSTIEPWIKRNYWQYNGMVTLLVVIEMAIIFSVGHLSKYNVTGVIFSRNIFNYAVYMGGLFLCAVSYCLLTILIKQLIMNERLLGNFNNLFTAKRINIVYFGVFVIGIIFIYLVSYFDLRQFDGGSMASRFLRYNINPVLFSIMIVIVCFFVSCLASRRVVTSQIYRVILSGVVAFVGAWLAYAPNIFQDRAGQLFHAEAYINSIINAMHHVPYDDVATSIYGHYGMIYYPFVKLFGGNTYAILFTIAVFVFFVYILSFYICSKLIRNDVFFTLAVIGVFFQAVTFFRDGQFYQIYPHRIFFPIICCAIVCYEEYEKTNKYIMSVVELLVGVMAFIFNFESGLVAIIIIVGHRIFSRYYSNNTIPFNIIYSVIYSIICFTFAWISVNMYNLVVGGECNNIMTFLFPIGSDIYKIDNLRTHFPGIGTDFFVMVIVFFIPICQSIMAKYNKIINIFSEKSMVCMALGLMGLGLLIYYVNRAAAGNASVSVIPFSILVCVCAENVLSIEKQDYKKLVLSVFPKFAIPGIALFMASYFCLESIGGIGIVFKNRVDSVRNTASLEESLETFQETIPESTPAFGLGIPTLYYYLGWDTHSYTLDFSDMNEYVLKEIHDNMYNQDSFVCAEIIEENEVYELVQTISTNDFTYYYYKRIE